MMHSHINLDDLQPTIKALESRCTYLNGKISETKNEKAREGLMQERASVARALEVLKQERQYRMGETN